MEHCIPYHENTSQQVDLAFNVGFMIYFLIRVSNTIILKIICGSQALLDISENDFSDLISNVKRSGMKMRNVRKNVEFWDIKINRQENFCQAQIQLSAQLKAELIFFPLEPASQPPTCESLTISHRYFCKHSESRYPMSA